MSSTAFLPRSFEKKVVNPRGHELRWGNMKSEILTDSTFCKYVELRTIQRVSQGLSVRCWFVKSCFKLSASVLKLEASGVTASAIEVELGRNGLAEKRAGLRRPYLLRIGVRSETGYGPKTDQTSGKARSWWTNEFPETVSVLPTSAP